MVTLARLRDHCKIVIDTSVWIYHFEQHPEFRRASWLKWPLVALARLIALFLAVVIGTAALEVSDLRRTDSNILYRAREVDLGELKLNTLVARVKVDDGVLTAAPVSAEFADGTIEAILPHGEIRASLAELGGRSMAQAGAGAALIETNGG